MILFLLIAQLSFTDDILEQTLPLDIQTSDYYELVAWCERLGIDSSGTRKELESRLLSFYDIEIDDKPEEPEGQSRITIKSAAGLDYFTLDVMEESYIRLSGGVTLVLEDKEEEGTHEINADSIVFNQDQHSLTASGNIEYVLTRDGKSEVFRGDSLTFDTDSWEGVFFQGVSERERSTENQVITFYYSGESIFRTEDNVVTLEKGTITSSERLPPNYSIKASKIWVLAPGEWAIKNAVLYLGYVPIFYFPAFFRPGDPLFLHPSLGYKQREGYFIQTTTYLLGKQQIDEEDTTISFLQTVGTENVERSIDGLFLRETSHLSPFQKDLRSFADKTDSFFKLLVDFYSRLGFLVALEGELKDLGILESFSLYAGLGRSRKIFQEALGYTPFTRNSEGIYTSRWDSSYFLNLYLPFRYGLDMSFNAKAGALTLSGSIPAYSDPNFAADFFNRKEKTDWSELLGFETGDETAAPETTQKNVFWNVKGSFTPSVKALNPYIDTLNITNLETAMYWKNRELVIEDEENSYFFYPDSVILPSLSATMKGTFFTGIPQRGKKTAAEEETEEEAIPSRELRSPWEEEDLPEEDPEQGEAVKPPALRGELTLPVYEEKTPFKHTLSYLLRPDFSYDVKMDSEDWENPDSIDYLPLYSMIYGKAGLQTTYNANIYDKLVAFSTSQQITVQRKEHIPGESLPLEEAESYEIQDNEATYLRVNESVSLTGNPFLFYDVLKESLFSYSLKFLAYRHEYDKETNNYFQRPVQWTEEDVQEHKLAFQLVAHPDTYKNTLNMTFQLPPLTRSLDVTAAFQTGPLTSTFIWSMAEDEETLVSVMDPLIIREKLSFFHSSTLEQELTYDFQKPGFSDTFTRLRVSFLDNNLALNQTFSYNLADSEPLEAATELKIWPLSLSFAMKDVFPYTFVQDEGWVKGEENTFLPVRTTASLNWEWKSDPLWKNRILLGTDLKSSYSMNLQQYTDNIFTFNLDFSFLVTDFLDITLKTRSENTAMHLYLRDFMESAGLEPRNIFQDLVDSFNFFDKTRREHSQFNLRSITLDATHKLEDWDLILSYTGEPELNTTEEVPRYDWEPTFTVMVQWNPIPEIKAEIKRDVSGELYF